MEAPSHTRSEVQSAIQEHLAEQREALTALDDALADGSSDDLVEARTHHVVLPSHGLYCQRVTQIQGLLRATEDIVTMLLCSCGHSCWQPCRSWRTCWRQSRLQELSRRRAWRMQMLLLA